MEDNTPNFLSVDDRLSIDDEEMIKNYRLLPTKDKIALILELSQKAQDKLDEKSFPRNNYY